VTDTANGKTALVGYVQAFERVNGRTPTEEENREALALVEVVRKANLDPFLVFYLANKRAQDALERVPTETRKAMDEGTARVAMDKIDTKLATIERLARSGKMTNGVAGIVRDIGCFLAGTVTSLLIVHLIIGERVDAAWLLVAAGAIGAAAATVVLWLAPRIQDAVNSR